MDFGGHPFTLEHLIRYAEAADRLGFDAVAANDHLVFAVPWLDAPTALAAVLAHTGDMTLATTVALPVVRGPVPLAKSLGAIDRLSGGRLLVTVGPGSSPLDYATVGIDFDERWPRLDEAFEVLRTLWQRRDEPFVGRYYSTEGIELLPAPARPDGPPLWIGSWGSDAGLRRVARLADGWLASAYNTTPERFAAGWASLREQLAARGRDPETFPNGLATFWFHISDDQTEADAVLHDRVAPVVHRPEDVLRARLAFGPPEEFAAKLNAFREAGAQRVFVWPVTDEVRQLELFAERVRPLVRS
jgi:probable F420-dependent oxidoreductase